MEYPQFTNKGNLATLLAGKRTQIETINEPPFTHMVWVEGEEHKWPDMKIVNKLNKKIRKSRLEAIHYNPQYDKEKGRWFVKCWKKPEGAL